jgi:ribosomal protein S18 acetylase RimI-like enzyme
MVGKESGSGVPEIRELTVADIDSLRLGWWSRFDPTEVRAVLEAAPGISTWMPETNEYALTGPWRHRSDIVHLIELISIRHPGTLAAAAVERARRAGVRLFLAVEMTERRRVSFYDQVGLSMLEEVLSYELLHPRASHQGMADMEPVTVPTPAALDQLQQIDSDAFPWLWRNSCAEFNEYLRNPGVEVHVLREAEEDVGYVGISAYPGWGHIDRVAVRASHQGRGLGRKLTRFAIDRLVALGSTRIGLSTQRRNERSQSLYESLGFKRQVGSDYQIYGCPLFDTDTVDELVMGPLR